MNSVGTTEASKPKKKSLMSKLMSRKPSTPMRPQDAAAAAAAATAAGGSPTDDRELTRRLSPARLARAETTGDNPGPESQQIRDLKNGALSIVVVGASGDLAKKKTYPALFALFTDGFLPTHASIVGYARRDKEDAEFREHLRPFLLKCKGATDAGVTSFLALCTYRKGGYDSAEAMGRVAAELSEKEAGFDVANRMFYLAIPPSVFGPSCTSIKASAMAPTGWTRVIVEKPFG